MKERLFLESTGNDNLKNNPSVSPDNQDQIHVFKEYEILYEQYQTIFSSLPVGVGVYSTSGALLHCNEAYFRIFGINEKGLEPQSDINNNLIVPDEVKEAIREGKVLKKCVLYDFSKQKDLNLSISDHHDIRYLDCSGQAIKNADGSDNENYILIINDITEQVKSEEKLRQSQRKIEMAMQTADIIFWEFDVQTQLFYNDRRVDGKYDYSNTLSLKRFMEIIHPEDQEKTTALAERLLNGEDFSFCTEDRICFPGSQEWQYCTVNGVPFERDNNGRIVKYVGTRKNNTELQRKKKFQEKILDSVPLPIHIKDVADNFRYVFCNEESKRMFGINVDVRANDVLEEEDALRVQKTDLEVFNTGEPYLGLERLVLKDGRSYDMIVRKSIIEDDGKRLLLNIRWDQSLQNEQKRRAQLLSFTMEMMDAFTWFYEPDKMRISFGDGFDKVGRKASEINSLEKYLSCVHPDDREEFASSLATLLTKGNGTWTIVSRIDFTGSGRYEWWESRGILETTTLNDAPYQYMFGMTINIEVHRQAMAELEQAKKLAEQSDKLKSVFLANMSHEIRTPLNAIIGFSELLMTTTEAEEQKEYSQIINDNNELLLKLINDILDLSKLEAGTVEFKYEDFDLSDYFDSLATTMKQRVVNPNVRLIVSSPYTYCQVSLDRNRLAQVLTNYVINSIKYTPKGFIEMGYECTEVGIRFYVRDTGIGIPDEKKNKVFQRFEKLDEFAQGTGLGLSICKAIAEAIGGSVGFESKYGQGSLFWVELPCQPELTKK